MILYQIIYGSFAPPIILLGTLAFRRSGLTNQWHACTKWHAAVTAVQIIFLFILPNQRLYIVRNVHVCVYRVFNLKVDRILTLR